MDDNNDMPIFPVAGWDIQSVPPLGIVTFCPSFLTKRLQPANEANPGRTYALTLSQGRELIAALQRALHALKTTPETPASFPKH